MSGLERGVHIVFFIVDKLRLHERGQNPGVLRAFKVLPHQLVAGQEQRYIYQRSILSDHPPLRWSTQIPIDHDKIGSPTKHHHPPISLRASSRGVGHKCHLANRDNAQLRTHIDPLQRRPLLVEHDSSKAGSHGVTVEEYGQPYIIHVVLHVSWQYLHHTTSRLLRRRPSPLQNQT